MPDATARKQAERARKEALGFRRLELWVKPEWAGRIRDFIKGLAASDDVARAKEQKEDK